MNATIVAETPANLNLGSNTWASREPIFTPAQISSLLNCIETTADINGTYSSVQLENRAILKGMLGGAK